MKGVSLVLGGGAARGLAHIGVLDVLDKNHIPIREIIGCSMGSVIGALYCAGVSPARIEEFVSKVGAKQVLKFVDLHWWDDYWVKGDRIRKLIISYISDCDFKDLKIPLKVGCTQMESQEFVVISKGKVVNAIMASSAVPGMLPPVKIDNFFYVDGGLCNPFPVRYASHKVIGVNVLPRKNVPLRRKYTPFRNTAGMLLWAYAVMQQSLIESSKVDVLIQPQTNFFSPFSFDKAGSLIESGRSAAKKALPKIRGLVGR